MIAHFFRPQLQLAKCIRRQFSLLSFATLDPYTLSDSAPHRVRNHVAGEWMVPTRVANIPDPLTGKTFLQVADVGLEKIDPFIDSLMSCPKSGLHNPLKNPERYLMLGDVCARAGAVLRDPKVEDFFAKLIQRVAPKSSAQALGEVVVTRRFVENFSGDQVRFLARSFAVPGDHTGQSSNGFRWPYGPCAVITPFNFPMEIPLLQLLGALFMGNRVLLKVDSRVSVVMEQVLRLLHTCGLPPTDVDLIHCDGAVMHALLLRAQPRMTLFTGSSRVAEVLAADLHGRIKLEDAGFDWKILGPDVGDVAFVAHTCDQDAYAFSGQKCSAQSILFMHDNWAKAGLVAELRRLAALRCLRDLTLGPVLSVSNDRFFAHLGEVLAVPGASLLFGGAPLSSIQTHSIPDCYGSWLPTAVQVPIESLLQPDYFRVCTEEIFGPFQIVVSYSSPQLPLVLRACDMMNSHLTAAIVSNDATFQREVLASTVNGTTYCGRRARTTGAPQNHWFGPAGDPRAAGIGTPEAIRLVWSCHREIIMDEEPLDPLWTAPART